MGTGSIRAPIARASSVSDAKTLQALEAAKLGQVVTSQPELARVTGVEREHHHAASNAPHLAQAGDRVLPVMNGGKSHRGVEGLVIERQVLGTIQPGTAPRPGGAANA